MRLPLGTLLTPTNPPSDTVVPGVADEELATQDPDSAIPLPDIKQARKKKEMEQEQARVESEMEDKRVKIKRSDKEAFRNVR